MVNHDKVRVNNLSCLEVFGGLSALGAPVHQACSENKTNWQRLESFWPDDMTADELFANAFAAEFSQWSGLYLFSRAVQQQSRKSSQLRRTVGAGKGV